MLNVNEVWEEVQKALKVKREFWEEKTGLEFDEHGRAEFGNLGFNIDEVFGLDKSFGKIAPSFQKAMKEWFLKKGVLGILCGTSVFVVGVNRIRYLSIDNNYFMSTESLFSVQMLKENNITFFILKEGEQESIIHDVCDSQKVRQIIDDGACKELTMKLSKFLGEVYEIWKIETEYGKEHEKNRLRIKQLRSEGFGYNDCQELGHLSTKNKSIEKHITYFDYQKLTNNDIGDKLFITINPFDILTSSGGSDCGSNPTSFPSCWSVNFPSSNAIDDYNLCKEGCFSEPSTMIKCGMITNRAILYIPNSNTTTVGKHTFIGYKKRCNVWIADEKSMFTELVYPSKMQSDVQEIHKVIIKNGFDIFKPNNIEEFKYQDDVYNDFLYSFENCSRSKSDGCKIFLDSVCLVDGKMNAMYTDRCDMGYHNVMNHPGKEQCKECGATGSDLTEIGGGDYVCDDCLESEYFMCSHCEEYIHNNNYFGTTRDGRSVCDYHAQYYDYSSCDECDCVERDCIIAGDRNLCEHCFDELGFNCSDCGESGLIENSTICHDEYHCENCVSNHTCDNCNDIIEKEEEFWLDDLTLCEHCYDVKLEEYEDEEEEEQEVV